MAGLLRFFWDDPPLYFWFTAAAALGEIPALWLALLLLKIAVLASMMKNDAEEQS